MNFSQYLKEKLKIFFLNSAKRRYANGRRSGFLSRLILNRKEKRLDSPEFTHEEFTLAKEYVREFLNVKKACFDFRSDLFLMIFPSTEKNHMSNHILSDFTSLLEQNQVSVWKIYGSRQLENFISRIVKSTKPIEESYERIWIISVMDSNQEFENQILDLKRFMPPNVNIVHLVNDLWREKDFQIFFRKFDHSDFFFHMDPFAMLKLDGAHRQKCHFFPFAGLNQEMFHPSVKENIICFSGSINMKYRRVYIDQLLSNFRGKNLRVVIKAFHYYRRNEVPSMIDYVNLLNRSKISIDLGKKEDRYWVLTGRSLESLASGCALLVDEPISGGPLSLIFDREKEFIPFHNKELLSEIVRDLDNHPRRLEEIRLSGYGRYRELFDHERLLSYLSHILQQKIKELPY